MEKEKTVKKKKTLHVSTVRALFLAFVLSISAIVFTYCTCFGKNEAKIEAEAETDVFVNYELNTMEGGSLAAKDLSAVSIIAYNVWGTDCPPCIAEFPDLEELSKSYAESEFRLIGIPLDVTDKGEKIIDERLSEAKRIIKDSGVTFSNIIPDKKMDTFIHSMIAGTPTTFFTDSEGKILKVVTGSRKMEYYKEVTDKILKEVKQ